VTELSFRARDANLALLFIVAFLIWLLNHPYQGIWHDARVYGLLAAHWLNPQGLANDLFFNFGSQGSFSLFTPVYGELAGWLGLDRAAWWVTLSGGLLWVGACLALSRTMLGAGFAARFAVFLGALVLMSYSPDGSTFILGENFATARSWAIPLGLASVAALAAKREGWSLGLALVAAALHPLLGVWPLALLLLVRLRFPLAVSLSLFPVAAVVLLGVTNPDLPHVRLMTGDWLDIATGPASNIVFQAPSNSRLPEYLGILVALWLGARLGSEHLRALYLRLLMLGIGGLGLALVASYAFPVEVVIQGQPWRVMALLIPLGAMAVCDLGGRAWGASVAGRLLVSLVAILASMNSSWMPGLLCVIGMASLMPMAWVGRIDAWAQRWRYWLGCVLAAVALSTVPNILAAWEIAGAQMLNPWWTGAEHLHGLLAGNSWHLAALLAVIPLWVGHGDQVSKGSHMPAFSAAILGVLAAGLVATVIYGWDRRSVEYRSEQACYLDSRCPPHPFRQWIGPGTTVFWPQKELTVWFEIGTASYLGEIQAIGKVFSAEKFYELQRRHTWVDVGPDPRHLCLDPILDWAVLPQPVPGLLPLASLRFAHLYACSGLRPVPQAPTLVRPAA
jgi:hypothetical protein